MPAESRKPTLGRVYDNLPAIVDARRVRKTAVGNTKVCQEAAIVQKARGGAKPTTCPAPLISVRPGCQKPGTLMVVKVPLL